MALPDLQEYHGSPNGTLDLPDEYFHTLFYVVSERDPHRMADKLEEAVDGFPRVRFRDVRRAIDLGEEIHYGQVREFDNPPPDEPNKPLTTHTVGTALLTAVLFGREGTTTVKLAQAVLHDGPEDGKWDIDTPKERKVTAEDIRWYMGPEIGSEVAWGVDTFSRVQDVPGANGSERIPVSDTVYDARLRDVDRALPEKGLRRIKFGADFAFSGLDPVIPLPSRRASRERKIIETRGIATAIAIEDPVVAQVLRGVAYLGEQSLQEGASPASVKTHLPILRRVVR